jgi:hypothetical protein
MEVALDDDLLVAITRAFVRVTRIHSYHNASRVEVNYCRQTVPTRRGYR